MSTAVQRLPTRATAISQGRRYSIRELLHLRLALPYIFCPLEKFTPAAFEYHILTPHIPASANIESGIRFKIAQTLYKIEASRMPAIAPRVRGGFGKGQDSAEDFSSYEQPLPTATSPPGMQHQGVPLPVVYNNIIGEMGKPAAESVAQRVAESVAQRPVPKKQAPKRSFDVDLSMALCWWDKLSSAEKISVASEYILEGREIKSAEEDEIPIQHTSRGNLMENQNQSFAALQANFKQYGGNQGQPIDEEWMNQRRAPVPIRATDRGMNHPLNEPQAVRMRPANPRDDWGAPASPPTPAPIVKAASDWVTPVTTPDPWTGDRPPPVLDSHTRADVPEIWRSDRSTARPPRNDNRRPTRPVENEDHLRFTHVSQGVEPARSPRLPVGARSSDSDIQRPTRQPFGEPVSNRTSHAPPGPTTSIKTPLSFPEQPPAGEGVGMRNLLGENATEQNAFIMFMDQVMDQVIPTVTHDQGRRPSGYRNWHNHRSAVITEDLGAGATEEPSQDPGTW